MTGDGKVLLTRDAFLRRLHFWRLADGALLHTYDQEIEYTEALAITRDGRYFAYGRGSDGTVVVARTPALITELVRTDNQARLVWQWGTGLYQLQQTANLASGVWENVGGLTTNTTATIPFTNTNTFFRIQNLPNP